MIYTNVKINNNLQQVIIVTNAKFDDLKMSKEIYNGLNKDLKRIANILALNIRFNGKQVEDVKRLVFNYKNLISPMNLSNLAYYSFIPDHIDFI